MFSGMGRSSIRFIKPDTCLPILSHNLRVINYTFLVDGKTKPFQTNIRKRNAEIIWGFKKCFYVEATFKNCV